jgi:thiamine pyrophosphokinase
MKAAIFLNGEEPSGNIIKNFAADYVICADGAYNYLKKYNTTVDIVVGDFDSIGSIVIENGVKTLKYPADKDMTDSELALRVAIERGADEIDFYGALGKREDHALSNIGLLFYALDKNVDAKIITDYNTIFAANKKITFDAPINRFLSVVPFCSELHILDTQGLKYPIKNKKMSFKSSLGISNEITSANVSIDIASGLALIIIVEKQG